MKIRNKKSVEDHLKSVESPLISLPKPFKSIKIKVMSINSSHSTGKKPFLMAIFAICCVIFLGCTLLCLFNLDMLNKKPFQQTTRLTAPAMAKYEKDGNIYIIDNGSFRLICMTPDGDILKTITIDKFKEYTRIIDAAIDEAGNIYVYAIEAEYDAILTKRDIVRKYDSHGRFVKDIISITYDDPFTNPRLFYQFGSFLCANGILTFSQTEKDKVTLYKYFTLNDDLQQSVFYSERHGITGDFMVAQLVLKDFYNFAYVLRDGDIYEVKNGGSPQRLISFNWDKENGGIHPWHIFYETTGNIVFFDMQSNNIYRINIAGELLYNVIPQFHFEPLKENGEKPALKGFGFFGNTFAGVYGDTVWLYDGNTFKTYNDELKLPLRERLHIFIIHTAVILGVFSFITGLLILFIGLLDKYVSLFIKQVIVVIPLLIIAFFIVFSVTYDMKTEQINEALFNEMVALSTAFSRMVDGDDVDRITSIKDVHSEEYKKLSELVKEFVGYNADPWNKAYYAAIFKGDNFEKVIVISSEELNLFRPLESLDEEDINALMSGNPIGGIYELYNGDWAVAEVPIYNKKGDVSGMLEVGFDMTGYNINNDKLKRDVAFIAVIVCLIILLALGFMISIIIRQLSSVARVLKAISDGKRHERVRYKARDELGRVSHGLNSMAEELQIQFDRITSLNESTIRFVPVQFMEHLGVSDISKMKLGDNVLRDLSVLFFDIRAFSINSEMMTSRENFLFINEILGIAGPIIRKHEGFVDKFIGDAAMALFVNGIDAVRAGIELYQQLVINKSTRVKIGVDGINIGVGIHTGSVMMGIVGENERLSSTVISANVNLASRLEGLSKQTGSGVLISKDTMNQLTGRESEFSYRFIGMVRAAGVNEVLGLFDIIDALPPKDKKLRLLTKKIFESGVRKFHTKDYAAAVHRFEKVVEADPGDICAIHHLEEARKHLEDSSLPSVFVFDKK